MHNAVLTDWIKFHCLIRLKDIRPRFFPSFLGISSENAAHRIAVTEPPLAGVLSDQVAVPLPARSAQHRQPA